MTDPLEGVTDAHLQAALDTRDYTRTTPANVRDRPDAWPHIIAHARTIAANETLAAELAELRAKYEPEVVDVVRVEAECLADELDGIDFAADLEVAIRRGMEMQPAPFTPKQAFRIGRVMFPHNEARREGVFRALTTPRADLLAMLGEG